MNKPFRYAHDMYHTIERDGTELDVFVEYAVEERGCDPSGLSGPPEHYDPGSGWLFCINENAETDDNTAITLTDAEVDAIHSWLEENPPSGDGPDDYD